LNDYDIVLKRMIDEFKYEEKLTEKQRNILVAAQKVFYEKGFHAGSTSEIAREANVAEGTIFRHYKNKKELLLSVVFPVLIKMAAPGILKDARKLLSNQEEPLEGILEKLIKNRLQVVKENWPRLKIAFIESQYHPEIKEAMEKYLANEGRMFLEAFLSARVESGEIKNKNVQIMTRTVFSTLAGYIISRHFFEDEGNEEEEIAVIVDILLHGLKITSSKL